MVIRISQIRPQLQEFVSTCPKWGINYKFIIMCYIIWEPPKFLCLDSWLLHMSLCWAIMFAVKDERGTQPTKFLNKSLNKEEIDEMRRETYWFQSGMNFSQTLIFREQDAGGGEDVCVTHSCSLFAIHCSLLSKQILLYAFIFVFVCIRGGGPTNANMLIYVYMYMHRT